MSNVQGQQTFAAQTSMHLKIYYLFSGPLSFDISIAVIAMNLVSNTVKYINTPANWTGPTYLLFFIICHPQSCPFT